MSRPPVRGLPAVCLLATAVLAAVGEADAHPAPFSFLDLAIGETSTEGVLVLHVVDVAHELGIEPADALLDPGELGRVRDRVIALITPRLTISAETALSIEWLGIEPAVERHGVLLRFRIPVARPGSVRILPRMFPYDPAHQTFVNIYEDDTLRRQLIFSAGDAAQVYYTGSTQGVLAVMQAFIPIGVHHILIGPDHILFLVGLLLLGGSWMALVRIVTAFTLGHSLTLSLAALALLTPPASIIEPAIALSIIFVGADNLTRGTGRDVRAWVALAFGLVHGFGFANVLREFGLPREALGWSLFSFNVGVEIGQLAIVLVVAGALAAIRGRSLAVARRVELAGSVVVIAAGTYWFVQRVFFP
ncbi:MAG: HupE/UreJ family protein [Acidobacteria bacterium]|nr:HupE/UreJ family protein [Acidobacteriota bacterium]